MNTNSYSVLFCFLLGSTFVHELRAKSAAPAPAPAPLLALPISNNGAGLEMLNRVERAAPTVGYGLVYETLSDIGEVYIITNSSSNDALIIDYATKIVILLNGDIGSGILIDICNNKGAYISKGLWEAKYECAKDYLSSLKGGLKELLDKDECETFNLDSANPKVLEEVTDIIVKLVVNIESDLRKDPTLSLKFVMSITGRVMSTLKALHGLNKKQKHLDNVDNRINFNGFLAFLVIFLSTLLSPKSLFTYLNAQVNGDDKIEVSVDLIGVYNVLEGIATVIEKVAGDLSKCIEKGVKLDLKALFGAKNGLDCLNILLGELGKEFDLSPLNEILSDPESFFKLVAKLGGNSPEGVTGACKVAGEIAALSKNKTKPEKTILVILQYVAFTPSKCKDQDLTAEFNSSISTLLKTIKGAEAAGALPGLVGILEDLIAGTLIALGVDLSAIIVTLLAGVVRIAVDLLALVVEVLLLLGVILDAVLAIPLLLLVLISQANTPYGIELLTKLGLEFATDLGAIVGTLVDILVTPLSTVTNLLLLGLLTLFDLLSGLPIIGDIVQALEAASIKATDGELSLENMLNEPNLVTDLLKGLIQSLTDVNLGVDPSVASQAKEVMKSTSNVTTYVYLEIEYPDKSSICC